LTDNIIKPIDDPFWDTHYAPNGFRCRCHIRSLSTAQAEAKGGTTLNVPANAKPDDGWDYNGGENRFEDLKRALAQKLERCKKLGFSVDGENCNKEAYPLLVQIGEKLATIENMGTKKHINYEQGRDYSIARPAWFSHDDAHIYADIESVKTHSNYDAAKSGSFAESVLLARHFMNKQTIDRISSTYHNPILLPIMAEEKMGKNAIPLGMVNIIKEATGWRVSDSIVQTNKAGHTGATGWHRITVPALFMGDVEQGASYVIIDDFIGMGGTAANIKSFIENSGAQVVGYEILTGLPESSKLYLRNETLHALRNKYGSIEQWFRQTVGFGYEGLTESEANYLIRSKSPERIRNQITRAIHEGHGG
jgi:adenine/guanine phosphoribosyltransferase-like PRPP-binding protein